MPRNLPQSPLAWCVLLCFTAVAGCASVQKRVTDTDHRVDVLEAQIADMQAAQHHLTVQLTEIRQALEGGIGIEPAQQADRGQDLRALQTEVSALGEQFLILEEQVAALVAQLANMQILMQEQEADLWPPHQPEGPPVAEDIALFEAAFLDFMAGEYTLAIGGFEEYLRRFPTAEKTDEGLYWIGESLAAQERHSEARARFLQVIQDYPESDMVPGARLRAALEAVELGQPEAAIQELRGVVTRYPESDALLVACMQLARMEQPLPAACQR